MTHDDRGVFDQSDMFGEIRGRVVRHSLISEKEWRE